MKSRQTKYSTFLGLSVAAVMLLLGLVMPGLAGAATLQVHDVNNWTSSNILPISVHQGSSAIYNGYIYQMGGINNTGSLANVYYAKLNSDGSVGSWSATTSMPNAVYQTTSIALNGYLYEVAGNPNGGSGSSNVVYYAPLNSNGTVGAWNTTTTLPKHLVGNATTTYNGYVYVSGGTDTVGLGLSKSVYYAKQNVDGTLGSWTTASTLPDFSYFGSSTAYNGYLYQVAGVGTGFADTSAIYYAAINTNGSIGSWQTATNSLPVSTESASDVAWDGYMYHIGGKISNVSQPAVYLAKLNSDGSVGSWQTSANALPTAVSESPAVVSNGVIYEVGGLNDSSNYTNTVYYSSIFYPTTSAVLSNAVNAAPVSISTPSGTNITCASATSESALAVQDNGYTYPVGLVNLCYTTNNAADQVTIVFVTSLTPSQVKVRNYNSMTHTYSDVAGAIITSTSYNGQAALQVTYSITDNGNLDSDYTTGSVNDPIGLATAIIAPDTGYGAHGISDHLVMLIEVPAVVLVLIGLAIVLRRKTTTSQ